MLPGLHLSFYLCSLSASHSYFIHADCLVCVCYSIPACQFILACHSLVLVNQFVQFMLIILLGLVILLMFVVWVVLTLFDLCSLCSLCLSRNLPYLLALFWWSCCLVHLYHSIHANHLMHACHFFSCSSFCACFSLHSSFSFGSCTSFQLCFSVYHACQLFHARLAVLLVILFMLVILFCFLYVCATSSCFCSPKGTIMKIRSILTCIMLSLPLYLNCKTFRCVYCFL